MQIPLGSTFQKCAPEPEMGAGMHDACMCLGLRPPVFFFFFSTLTEDTPEPWALDGFRKWGHWWLVVCFFFLRDCCADSSRKHLPKMCS